MCIQEQNNALKLKSNRLVNKSCHILQSYNFYAIIFLHIQGDDNMSNVKNEPKLKNGILQAIRAQLEHRAFWLYLLCDEAGKRGLTWEDFGSAAVKRCGLSQGADLVKKGGTDSLRGLKKTLFTKPAQWVFEMDIKESTDDTLFIDFHYCLAILQCAVTTV